VALGPQYVKPAQADYLVVFGVRDLARALDCLLPLLFGRLFGVDLFLFQILTRQKLRVAAKLDVGSATGHVGRYRDLAFAPRLGDDVGLAPRVLRLGV